MSSRFNIRRSQHGFSLLEILVAFSILALSLGVLFQIYSRGSGVTAFSRDYTQALIVAQSQLAVLEQTEVIEVGEESGISKDQIKWQRRVFAYEDPLDTAASFRKRHQLVNVEVEVSWETMGRPRTFTLKSLRLTAINNVRP